MKIGILITTFGPVDPTIYHDHLAVLLEWKKEFNVEVYHIADMQQEQALNNLVNNALADNCTHLFFMEHDNLYTKDTLKQLLVHDVDAVSGYYPYRNWPFLPIPLMKCPDNGLLYRLEYVEGNGSEANLIPITIGCFGCCLIKAHVFKTLFDKGLIFRRDFNKKMQSTLTPDVVLFNDMYANGFILYIDGRVRVGHMTSFRMIVDPDNFRLIRIMIQLIMPGMIPEEERFSEDQKAKCIKLLMEELKCLA